MSHIILNFGLTICTNLFKKSVQKNIKRSIKIFKKKLIKGLFLLKQKVYIYDINLKRLIQCEPI